MRNWTMYNGETKTQRGLWFISCVASEGFSIFLSFHQNWLLWCIYSRTSLDMDGTLHFEAEGGPDNLNNFTLTTYRGSPVSAVFGSPAKRTIEKTALIGDWFSTKTAIWDFWVPKVHLYLLIFIKFNFLIVKYL